MGYLENRFYLINNQDFPWSDFSEKFKLADYNRLRLRLKANPSDQVSVSMAVDFFSFHGILTSPLGTYTPEDNTPNDLQINLDRAYVDINFKNFDLTIGKQRVAMGVSYIWAPLDIFNRVNIFEPKEEKPGINAFKVYVPLGDYSGLTAVFSPDESFNASKSGLRLQTQAIGIDMAFTFIQSGQTSTTVYGLDFRGENFIGWWVELAAFIRDNSNNIKVVFGFDYTFPIGTGLYWLNEFFYDASGERDPLNYNYQLLTDGERFTLGQMYFLSMFRYSLSDFLIGSISYIGNWNDGSFIINPNFQYEMFQNASLTCGFYFPLGKSEGEFSLAKKSVFFIWLKIHF